MLSLSIIAPALAILAILLQRSHLLMILLALESLTLSLVLLIPMLTTHSSMSMFMISIVLLSFGACEASLGLSILVMMSRSLKNDLIENLSLAKC